MSRFSLISVKSVQLLFLRNPNECSLFIQHMAKNARQFLMSAAMYNITSDSGVNVCATFKVLHNFHQMFSDDGITNVCACMNDYKNTPHM